MTAQSPKRRRLLMITFHYPPSNTSSGGLRPLKFGKHLGELGWDCSVLTAPSEVHESVDPALLGQIPANVTLHRAYCFDAKAKLSIRGRHAGFVVVPDRYASWLPFAVRRALRIVREEGADAIYSTSPIPTAHLIGLAVRARTALPWIADFRDPWVETEGSEVYGRVRLAAELALEARVVAAADRVLVTTPELGAYLAARYGGAIEDKTRVAYNGFDEDDFQALPEPKENGDCFRVVHAGLLHPDYRDPVPVLRAIRLCLDRGWLPPNSSFEFVGVGDPDARARVAQMAADAGVQDVVRATERVPYRRALEMLAEASALLLLQGGDDTRMLIPAKAFEYLNTGRLILTLTPVPSATARLVGEFGGCFVAAPRDVDAIARELGACHDAWKSGIRRIDRGREGLDRYSRRAAAAALLQTLEGLLAERSGATAVTTPSADAALETRG